MARTKEEWTAQANQHADGAMAIMAMFARDGKIEISPSLLHTLLSGSYIEGALAAVFNCDKLGHGEAYASARILNETVRESVQEGSNAEGK